MLDKLPEVLKAIGTYIAGIAFVAGVVFCFVGFFDIGDLKSLKLRDPTAWPPIVAGITFVAVGLALYLFRPPNKESNADSQQSAGSIYVLRHMSSIGDYRPSNYFGYQLYAFNSNNPTRTEFETQRSGWEKASDYAVRALTLRGLAVNEGSEYMISDTGKKYVHSDSVRAKYTNAFSKPLV